MIARSGHRPSSGLELVCVWWSIAVDATAGGQRDVLIEGGVGG